MPVFHKDKASVPLIFPHISPDTLQQENLSDNVR